MLRLTAIESTAPFFYLQIFHVLPANVDDGGDAGLNVFGGAEMRHRLYQGTRSP